MHFAPLLLLLPMKEITCARDWQHLVQSKADRNQLAMFALEKERKKERNFRALLRWGRGGSWRVRLMLTQ